MSLVNRFNKVLILVKFIKWFELFFVICITNIIYADNIKNKLNAVESELHTAFYNQNAIDNNPNSSVQKNNLNLNYQKN